MENLFACSQEMMQRVFRRLQQRVLVEEVATGVTGEGALGEDDQADTAILGLFQQLKMPRRVDTRIGKRESWDCRGNAKKTVVPHPFMVAGNPAIAGSRDGSKRSFFNSRWR